MNFSLPAGFGYVLAELHLNIEQDRAQDWESEAMFLMSQIDSAHKGMDYRQAVQFRNMSNDGAALNAKGTRINAGTMSRIPITPGQEGVFTSFRAVNLNATAAAAGKVNAVISFWEYDLEQMIFFASHMAANVVGR